MCYIVSVVVLEIAQKIREDKKSLSDARIEPSTSLLLRPCAIHYATSTADENRRENESCHILSMTSTRINATIKQTFQKTKERFRFFVWKEQREKVPERINIVDQHQQQPYRLHTIPNTINTNTHVPSYCAHRRVGIAQETISGKKNLSDARIELTTSTLLRPFAINYTTSAVHENRRETGSCH